MFPVPNICEFLTSESKLRVYYTTERDEQGSKINDFFLRAEDLFNEMNWQKKLRGERKWGEEGRKKNPSNWLQTVLFFMERGVNQMTTLDQYILLLQDYKLHTYTYPRTAIRQIPSKT